MVARAAASALRNEALTILTDDITLVSGRQAGFCQRQRGEEVPQSRGLTMKEVVTWQVV